MLVIFTRNQGTAWLHIMEKLIYTVKVTRRVLFNLKELKAVYERWPCHQLNELKFVSNGRQCHSDLINKILNVQIYFYTHLSLIPTFREARNLSGPARSPGKIVCLVS